MMTTDNPIKSKKASKLRPSSQGYDSEVRFSALVSETSAGESGPDFIHCGLVDEEIDEETALKARLYYFPNRFRSVEAETEP